MLAARSKVGIQIQRRDSVSGFSFQMIEGFNEAWIEFEGSVKGQTSLKTVLEEMVRDARKQAA